MVLRSRLLLSVWLMASCVHRAPPARLSQPAAISVAMLLDAEAVSAVPAELQDAVTSQLAERNLEATSIDAPEALAATRNTQQRLAQLSRSSATPYVLLLETKVTFYEILQGRYRWIVNARISVARKDDLAGGASIEVEAPVFLLYDHERAPEALRAAAATLADKAGALVDNFLGGQKVAGQGLYFILVDRYASGQGPLDARDPQGFHGGDLQGVIDHLDELQSLGIGTVWLSPVFKMRTEKFFGYGAFHGYWTEDLTQVEPRFGDTALLRRLSDELHRRGMRLYLDLVLNHVAPEAALARAHPDWFHHEGSISDWSDPTQMETHDVSGLPDLAQEKPEVYRYLLDASLHWIDSIHPDGFRLDAVKHIPVSFWQAFNRDVHAHAGAQFVLLGEALDGDPARLAALQRDAGFDALFDFPLKFALAEVICHGKPLGRLAATLSLDRLYPRADALVTLLDDHDLPRIATECGGDLAKVKQALLVQAALRGTPALTWGTESGLLGAKEPDNRGDMRFDQQPLRPWIAQLLLLRREHPALSAGTERIVAFDGKALLIERALNGDAFLLALNTTAAGELLIESGEVRLYRAAPRPLTPGNRTLVIRGAAGLRAVGAGPELGSWDPAHGLQLGAHAELPVGTVAEFKLARPGKQGFEWESGDDRFVFIAPGDGPVIIDATWRS